MGRTRSSHSPSPPPPLPAAQVAAGIAGVVVLGTTGESPTVTDAERAALISAAVTATTGTGTKVIVGTGSNSTAESVALTAAAQAAGAHACLLVNPYYNKPTQVRARRGGGGVGMGVRQGWCLGCV
jgi:dihydrodipicolinate synthase/N-acetylneuraminate lyase